VAEVAEAGAFELFANLVAVRLGLVVAVDERFEQVHQYVEHAFLHHDLFAMRM
jgi:hypothetical protein